MQKCSKCPFSPLAFSPNQFHTLPLKWPNCAAGQNPPMVLHNPLEYSSNSWAWLSKPFIMISLFAILFTYLNIPSWSQDVLKKYFPISNILHPYKIFSHYLDFFCLPWSSTISYMEYSQYNPSGFPHPWTFFKCTTLLWVVLSPFLFFISLSDT